MGVVLLITANVPVTLLVALSVLLVDFFLVALIYYWSLTFNSIVVVNVVIAIGLAVDYSAHIAHTYLVVVPPAACKTDAQKRKYKAMRAVSQMGSSVFHGGFSTFLAISVLGSSKSYVFLVFYRLWFGIIIFGMSNGFLLLPVILSYIGPLNIDMKSNGVEAEKLGEIEKDGVKRDLEMVNQKGKKVHHVGVGRKP